MRIIPVIAAAILAIAIAPTAALADPPPSPLPPDTTTEGPAPVDGVLETEEQARARDTAAIAKLVDVPLAEAEQRVDIQFKVIDYLESLPAAVLTDSYAGGRLDFTAAQPAILYFKGQVPSAVSASAPAEVKLQGGQKYTLDELAARQNSVHAAAEALGFKQIVSSFDLVTQRITVAVALQPGRPSLRGQLLRDSMATTASKSPVKVPPTEFAIVEHPANAVLATPETGHGGSIFLASGFPECTSGFVVRRSDGVEGLLTAGHCEGVNQMYEHNSFGGTIALYSAPFVSEHIGVNGDMEWHTTSTDDVPQYWATYNIRNVVTSRITYNAYFVGMATCHFGRWGGYSCGIVSSLNQSVSFIWAGCGCTRTAQNLVGTVNANSASGDSGGPWYFSGQAHGLHWGQAYDGQRLFSRIHRAESQFGVNVQFG